MATTPTLQLATSTDRVALTDLIRSLRPDWDRWLIESVLQSHCHNVDVADLVIAAVRWAKDPNNHTPKGIGWAGRHWRDLDTQPPDVAHRHARCDICGKPEPRCITERPGPDDHPFVPVR